MADTSCMVVMDSWCGSSGTCPNPARDPPLLCTAPIKVTLLFLFFKRIYIKVTLHSSNSNLRVFARLLSNHREINLQHLNLICTFFAYWNLLLHGCSISMPITRRTTSIGARAASGSSSSTNATTFPSPSSPAVSRTYVTSNPYILDHHVISTKKEDIFNYY